MPTPAEVVTSINRNIFPLPTFTNFVVCNICILHLGVLEFFHLPHLGASDLVSVESTCQVFLLGRYRFFLFRFDPLPCPAIRRWMLDEITHCS